MAKDSSGVDRGAVTVGQTDSALRKIIESSEKSVEMNTRIAQATAEQASGTRDVARSIADVSDRSAQISRATAEQSRGSETIIRSIENMRDLAEQLRKATTEQSSGAKLIAKAGEGATLLAQEVSRSAQEGSGLSRQAVDEMHCISAATAETLEIVTSMNRLVKQFEALSTNMKNTLSHFKV